MAIEQISAEERAHIVEEKRSTNKKAMRLLLILLAIVVVLFAGVYITQIVLKKEEIRFAQFENTLTIIQKYEDNSIEKSGELNIASARNKIMSNLANGDTISNKTAENMMILSLIDDYNKMMFYNYKLYFSSVPISKLDENDIKKLLKDVTKAVDGDKNTEGLIAGENTLWDMFAPQTGFSHSEKQGAFYSYYLPRAVEYQVSLLELNKYMLDLLHKKDIYFPPYIEDLIYIQQHSLKSILTNGLKTLEPSAQDSGAHPCVLKSATLTGFISKHFTDYSKLGSFVKNDATNKSIVDAISASQDYSSETKFAPLLAALTDIATYYKIGN